MSTVLPSSLPLSPAQSAGMVLSPLTVADAASAGAVAELAQGTVLDGQVQQKSGTNQIIVQTGTAGTLTLQAKGAVAEALTPGASVALQVVPGPDGQMALRVLSVDGQAVARPLNLPSLPSLAALLPEIPVMPEQIAAASVAVVPAPVLPPMGLVATVIRAPDSSVAPQIVPPLPSNSGMAVAADSAVPTALPASSQSGGLPTDLPVGTTVTLRILQVSDGAPAPGALVEVPSASQAPAQVQSPVVSVSPQGVVGTDVKAAQTLSADTPSSSTPTSVLGDQPTEQSSPSGLPVLDGRVVSTIPGQRANVATPIGVLSLPPVAALKPNADVRFEVISRPVLPDGGNQDESNLGNMDPIKVLNDGMAALASSGEQQVLQQILSTVPQLDVRLAASLSMLMKTMDRQAGKIKSEEDDAEAKEIGTTGGKDLAARMNGALRQMAEDVTEHSAQEGTWAGFKLPVNTGDLILPVQFFVRQPPSDDRRVQLDGDEKGTGGVAKNRDQRFLVELMLSRLGRFQMDGLVQRTDKRFDLIVRTGQPLSRDVRNDITDLFITTTEAAGSRGSVTFQSGGRFVNVQNASEHTKMTI